MAMTEHEIFARLAEILVEVGGVSASLVTREADIVDDLGISSLWMVEIIIAAEGKFNVEIPDDALKDLRTVQDVVSYVHRVQASGAGLGMESSASEVPAT